MIENIREEFVKILYETDWMDDVSRKHALAKVSFVKFNSPSLIRWPKSFSLNRLTASMSKSGRMSIQISVLCDQ